MDTATAIMVALAIALLMVAFLRGRMHLQGLQIGGRLLWKNALLLVASFLVAGLVQVLLPKEAIQRWLGAESGFRGIILGCLAGALTPGPPYAAFPIVGSFYQSGASIGVVVGFVSAWSLWSVTRIPTEVALIGGEAALSRVAATLLVPPLAGLFAQHVLSRIL